MFFGQWQRQRAHVRFCQRSVEVGSGAFPRPLAAPVEGWLWGESRWLLDDLRTRYREHPSDVVLRTCLRHAVTPECCGRWRVASGSIGGWTGGAGSFSTDPPTLVGRVRIFPQRKLPMCLSLITPSSWRGSLCACKRGRERCAIQLFTRSRNMLCRRRDGWQRSTLMRVLLAGTAGICLGQKLSKRPLAWPQAVPSWIVPHASISSIGQPLLLSSLLSLQGFKRWALDTLRNSTSPAQ